MHLPAMPDTCLMVLSALSLAAVLWGQNVATSSDVRGEVTWEGGGQPRALSVELVARGSVVGRTDVKADGAFELAGVPAGEYELRLTDTRESVLARQFIAVHGHMDGLSLRVARPVTARPPAGTVTLNSLTHPAPPAAEREFLRAAKAMEKGDGDQVRRRLRKALAIFPGYAEAHNDLGVEYMKEGAYAEAADEFQRAVEIDPAAARPNTNLALAWFALGRYAYAEQAARRAMAADPSFPQAKRALDLVLRSEH